MKRMLVSVVALCSLAVGASAYNGWGVYLATWDAGDVDTGVGPAFKISMEMVPDVQLELRTAYFSSFDGHSQDLTVVPLEANLALRYELNPMFTGYGGLGVGYYLLDGGRRWDGALQKPDPDNEVGFFAVAGVDMPVKDNAGLFLEFQYRVLEAGDANAFGDRLDDLNLDGIGVNIGLMIDW